MKETNFSKIINIENKEKKKKRLNSLYGVSDLYPSIGSKKSNKYKQIKGGFAYVSKDDVNSIIKKDYYKTLEIAMQANLIIEEAKRLKTILEKDKNKSQLYLMLCMGFNELNMLESSLTLINEIIEVTERSNPMNTKFWQREFRITTDKRIACIELLERLTK